MARGHQKAQSQEKNKKKQQEMKKSQSHDQKAAAQKALTFVCSICKVGLNFRFIPQSFLRICETWIISSI